MKPVELLRILSQAARLKTTMRHCYTAEGRRESVADHSWRIALIAMLMTGIEEYQDFDMDKVIRMCLIHDLGESFTGDIPTFEKDSADEKVEDDLFERWVDAFPEPDMELRASLNSRMKEEGMDSLRYQLKQLDPVSYDQMDIANPQRVIRALEVTLQTGRRYSDWKTDPSKKRPFRIEKTGLWMDREKLYDRINRRVDKMMEEGLLDEVKSLDGFRYSDGVFRPDLLHIPPLRTVGYRELFDYLDGKCSLDEAVEKIKTNTRHYAKRQMSYWGRDRSIKWITV